MTVYLLDINVLLALSDPMHLHHEPSHQWFAEKGHSKYPNRPGDVPFVSSILSQICETPGHHFWANDLSILEMLKPDAIVTHNQITDLYLLGLALHYGGKLSTLDKRIPVDAVLDGGHAMELIIS